MITYISAEDAVKSVKSGERVFIQTAAGPPQRLIKALVERHSELNDVEFMHMHTEGNADYAKPEYSNSFRVNCFFVAGNTRPYINNFNIEYNPMFLSEIPVLFRKNILPLDTALVQVSEPDIHGFCSLGISVDITKAATDVAKKTIALVNPNMPRSHGDGLIHFSKFHSAVYADDPILEFITPDANEVELAIGKHIATLVEDGSTLQMGFGGIPNAVLACLENHKDLGIHTELFSNGILPLVEKGIINGSRKKLNRGKIVSSIAMGNKVLYQFIHDNPVVNMLEISYVNDTAIIRQFDKMVAINSAIEIDLTGQVCADSIGSSIYSGVGGQMDFIRGATLSNGGKAIIAMASITSKGESKIVPMLKPGAGVVTTRAHVNYIVTEYGIANLWGKNLAQRARELINIAHPNHREELERQAYLINRLKNK